MNFVNKLKTTCTTLLTDNDEVFLLVDGCWYEEPEETGELVLITDPEMFKELVEAYNKYQ